MSVRVSTSGYRRGTYRENSRKAEKKQKVAASQNERKKTKIRKFVPLIVSKDCTQNNAYGTVRSSNEIGFSSMRR